MQSVLFFNLSVILTVVLQQLLNAKYVFYFLRGCAVQDHRGRIAIDPMMRYYHNIYDMI